MNYKPAILAFITTFGDLDFFLANCAFFAASVHFLFLEFVGAVRHGPRVAVGPLDPGGHGGRHGSAGFVELLLFAFT